MTDLDALITKLEEAKEGSRELDCTICETDTRYEVPDRSRYYNGKGPFARNVHNGCRLEVPRYTTSLDAALTLVSEKWLPSCGVDRNDQDLQGNTDIYGWAELDNDPYDGTEIVAYGATQPLAVCIAALKARGE